MTKNEVASQIRDVYASYLVCLNIVKSIQSGYYVSKSEINQACFKPSYRQLFFDKNQYPVLSEAFDEINKIHSKANLIFKMIAKYYFREVEFDNKLYYKAINNPQIDVSKHIEELDIISETISFSVKNLYKKVIALPEKKFDKKDVY